MFGSEKHIMIVGYFLAFSDLFAVSLFLPLMMKYIHSWGTSATTAGFIMSIYGFTQFFSAPLMGRLTNSYGCENILTVCLLLSALSYILLSLEISLQFLIFTRFIAGLFKHVQLQIQTITIITQEKNYLAQAIGRLNLMGNLAFILGPAISSTLMRIGFVKFKNLAEISGIIFLLNFGNIFKHHKM
ncbi:hypothetical protein A3Q56_02556 [Intoshia linei]|uniref:Major facilitator superfamily (MFS) profile domain-containing protein n=1 Tax=Intoshia linei TaxID=1819745 RepID=A0A177B7U9_9BILA|nr:hypothetical protein A3Q56_02556 [Intoshia linei]